MVNRFLMAVFIAMLGVFSAQAAYFMVDKITYETVNEHSVAINSCASDLVDAVVPPTVTYNGDVYNVVSVANKAFFNNSNLETLTLPESVTSIGEQAFFMAKKIREINMPGVSSIGKRAFFMSSVQKVNFSDKLTELPDNAFESCTSNLEIDLSGIKTIGASAFDGCKIENVSISDGTTLGKWAFQQSVISSLTITGTINLPTGANVFDNAKVETMTLIDVNFTSNSDAVNPSVNELKILQINNDAMVLGITPSRSGAKKYYIDANISKPKISPFSNSTSLTEVVFGPKAKVLFQSMFYNCQKLNTVRLSTGIEEICHEAFSNCNSITLVECPSAEPPVCSQTAFSTAVYENSELQVPEESTNAYSTADGWKLFKKIHGVSGIEDINAYKEGSVSVVGGRLVFDCPENTQVRVYDAYGRMVYSGTACDIEPGRGFFVVCIGQNTFKFIL